MDSITTFLKENYDMIVLLLSVLGVLIAVISLSYELKKKSKNKKTNDHKKT